MSQFNFLGTSSAFYGRGERQLSFLDRTRHVYVLGKTGSGKSTLLSNLLIQDILHARGVGLIDPHGELAESLIEHIPRGRTREVIYLNLADLDRPIAWNPLEPVPGLPPATLAFAIVSACKHIWRESWGPRMEYILTNALHALVEAGGSLIDLPEFLADEDAREKFLAKVRDPKVLHFFENEFSAYDEKGRQDIISPIQNKIGQVLQHENLRNVLSFRKGTLRLDEVLSRGQILIVNLGKGILGEEPANLFGSLLVSVLGSIALARSRLPKEQWVPFFLTIDEFQNFSTDAFAGMLSEVRKYNLGLVLAHQYLGQLKDSVRGAVLGNVGTKVFLTSGVEDAELLRLECFPYPPTYLLEVPPFEGLLRMGGNEAEPICLHPPFNTLKVREFRTGRGENIRRESRRRFGVDRSQVEKRVLAALRRKKPLARGHTISQNPNL